MDKIIYLDNAATSPMNNETLYGVIAYMSENYGNASTSYSLGRRAKKTLERSRNTIADSLKCNPEGVYFTSGGTESDNMLIKGLAKTHKGKHIITSCIEHPAVLNTCKELEKDGYSVTYLPVNGVGRIDTEQLEKAITEDTCLITIMTANNEIGTVEPIEEIVRIGHKHNIVVHSDMVQAIGHIPLNINDLELDSFSCSGHKFGSPKGVGIAYIKPGIDCDPLIFGGGQENGLRSGTENVPNIAGMAIALSYATRNIKGYKSKMESLRQRFLNNLGSRPYMINGSKGYRLPGLLSISFPNVDGENLKLYLDTKGICVSNGSACHSGSIEPSHVLKAIGTPDKYINGTIRISFGNNSLQDIDYVADCIKEYLRKVNKNEISRE